MCESVFQSFAVVKGLTALSQIEKQLGKTQKRKRKPRIKQEPDDIQWPNSDIPIDITGSDDETDEPFLDLSGLEEVQEVQKVILFHLNLLWLILFSIKFVIFMSLDIFQKSKTPEKRQQKQPDIKHKQQVAIFFHLIFLTSYLDFMLLFPFQQRSSDFYIPLI